MQLAHQRGAFFPTPPRLSRVALGGSGTLGTVPDERQERHNGVQPGPRWSSARLQKDQAHDERVCARPGGRGKVSEWTDKLDVLCSGMSGGQWNPSYDFNSLPPYTQEEEIRGNLDCMNPFDSRHQCSIYLNKMKLTYFNLLHEKH